MNAMPLASRPGDQGCQLLVVASMTQTAQFFEHGAQGNAGRRVRAAERRVPDIPHEKVDVRRWYGTDRSPRARGASSSTGPRWPRRTRANLRMALATRSACAASRPDP